MSDAPTSCVRCERAIISTGQSIFFRFTLEQCSIRSLAPLAIYPPVYLCNDCAMKDSETLEIMQSEAEDLARRASES